MKVNQDNNINSVVLFQIDKTSKIAKQFSQRGFDRLNFGITVDQWVLLKIIQESGKMSQSELAEKSIRDPASITRTIDLLEKKGFVNREQVKGDRRKYMIVLTKHAEKFIKDNMPFIKEQRALSVDGFTSDELDLLNSFLKRIQGNMS